MKELRFFGASDDLFVCAGAHRDELCNNADGSTLAYHLRSAQGELIVTARYADRQLTGAVVAVGGVGATWAIGVAMVDEGIPLPAWPLRFATGPARGFPNPKPSSPMLLITVPDDTIVIGLQS